MIYIYAYDTAAALEASLKYGIEEYTVVLGIETLDNLQKNDIICLVPGATVRKDNRELKFVINGHANRFVLEGDTLAESVQRSLMWDNVDMRRPVISQEEFKREYLGEFHDGAPAVDSQLAHLEQVHQDFAVAIGVPEASLGRKETFGHKIGSKIGRHLRLNITEKVKAKDTFGS